MPNPSPSSWYAPGLRPVTASTPTASAPAPKPVQMFPPEQQLRLLEAIMAYCKEFVATVDEDWRFTFVNQQFLRTYGMKSIDQALGKTPFDIYPGFRGSVFFSAMDDVMTRRRAASRVGYSELTKRWYLCRGMPINGGAAIFATDITDDAENRAKLVSYSNEDPLTGLPNYVALEARVSDLTTAKTPFWFALVHLDRLKTLTDALGRADADKMVMGVASRLRGLAESGLDAYRVDTGEFALLGVGSAQDGRENLERALALLSKPVDVQSGLVALTFNVGVVEAPEDGEQLDELLRRAGFAATASRKVRGAPTRFESGMESHVVDRLRLERALHNNVTYGLLTMKYQPRLDSRTGRPAGLDAIVDWALPTDVEAPLETIHSVAAECGLMAEVDRWALRTVCEHASVMRSNAPILVRLSSAMLSSTSAVDAVREALAAKNLEPGRLEVEVGTDTLALSADSGNDTLAKLADLGVKLVASGFSDGLAGLTSLASSRISAVKLSSRLIEKVATEDTARTIAAALVGLAHSLKLSVAAVGVDTPEQLTALRDMHCDTVAGAATAAPMPIGEAGAYVRRAESGSAPKTNAFG